MNWQDQLELVHSKLFQNELLLSSALLSSIQILRPVTQPSLVSWLERELFGYEISDFNLSRDSQFSQARTIKMYRKNAAQFRFLPQQEVAFVIPIGVQAMELEFQTLFDTTVLECGDLRTIRSVVENASIWKTDFSFTSENAVMPGKHECFSYNSTELFTCYLKLHALFCRVFKFLPERLLAVGLLTD